MGLLTPEESENNGVMGYLDAENVFNRIKKHLEEEEINKTPVLLGFTEQSGTPTPDNPQPIKCFNFNKIPLAISDFDIFKDNPIQEAAEELFKQSLKAKEDCLIEFLENNGYKPERTVEYMENLREELKAKGLMIQIEETVGSIEHEEKNGQMKLIHKCNFDVKFAPYVEESEVNMSEEEAIVKAKDLIDLYRYGTPLTFDDEFDEVLKTLVNLVETKNKQIENFNKKENK